MTEPDSDRTQQATRNMGETFDFARRLRDPEVRRRLGEIGFDGGAGHVVIVLNPGESVAEAKARKSDDAARYLFARRDPAAPCGWTMEWEDEA